MLSVKVFVEAVLRRTLLSRIFRSRKPCNGILLTYMSIRKLIKVCLADGRLVELPPPEGRTIERTVLLSPEVSEFVQGPWISEDAEKRCSYLRGDLHSFIAGEMVSISLTPYKARNALLGILEPAMDGFFDFRGREPRPGLRITGGFSEPDVFVGLHLFPRGVAIPWIDRKSLGAGNSPQWKAAITETVGTWAQLFGSEPPISGSYASDFLSDATKFREV